MEVPESGVNNEKALRWVESFEDFQNPTIEFDPWCGHFIEVARGDVDEVEFTRRSNLCYNLFHTPMWAKEWR